MRASGQLQDMEKSGNVTSMDCLRSKVYIDVSPGNDQRDKNRRRGRITHDFCHRRAFPASYYVQADMGTRHDRLYGSVACGKQYEDAVNLHPRSGWPQESSQREA